MTARFLPARMDTSRVSTWSALALAVLLSLLNLAASAADSFKVGGFGTLGYAADNRSDIAASRDIGQLPKNNYATGASWKIDTRLGVQLEYKASDTIDLVAQLVARDHFKASLNSSTELAYLAAHIHPSLDVRVGRLNYDAFLMSDHRNVGYAYTWVRPPLEFYGWIPIFSVNGIDTAYTVHDGSARWRFKAQAGNSRFWIPVNSGKDGGYQFRTDNLTSLSATRESGSWRLKAAHSRFTIDSEVSALAPLHAALDGVGSPEALDLRKNLSFKGAKIDYTTLGAVYDDNTWLAQAEFGQSHSTAAVVPNSRMFYVSVGRRFGDWLPFVMFSDSHPNTAPRTAVNPALAVAATTMNSMRIDQRTISIGARWDFHPQAALKLQLDSTHSHPPGYGVWTREPTIANTHIRLNMLTATLDFVF